MSIPVGLSTKFRDGKFSTQVSNGLLRRPLYTEICMNEWIYTMWFDVDARSKQKDAGEEKAAGAQGVQSPV